jgi:hypothetical protein
VISPLVQVRAVATAVESSAVWIFTGSRDTTIKAWQDDGMHITEASTLVRDSLLPHRLFLPVMPEEVECR